MATKTPQVAWVDPPDPIRGLDHLGVQAPCIALYGQLLPGITNVTDRARYFSFYPWLIRAFERRSADYSMAAFRSFVRRAECLFALIAIRHARQLNEPEDRHGAGMVGRRSLLQVDEGATAIDLEALAGAYFTNSLGGLGQYYFGPMRDLRVLDKSPKGDKYAHCYDRQRGGAIADAFDAGVPAEQFLAALEVGTVTWAELDTLHAFCPCGLHENLAERSALLDMFFARTDLFRGDGTEVRCASLALMLDLAGRAPRDVDHSFADNLRAATYSGALADGAEWIVPAALRRAQRGWATYQRNELLSLATQGLFAAILRGTRRDRQDRLKRTAEAADVSAALLETSRIDLARPLADFVSQARADLPPLAAWSDPAHELQCAWRLLAIADSGVEDCAALSVKLLGMLLARGLPDAPYADFDFATEYFDPREIHLRSFRDLAHGEWSTLRVGEWVRWLAVHWGVGRHLQVALRKVRHEGKDTFRIRPLEGELRVVEIPEPVFTVPRVGRSVQILVDLGLLEASENGSTLTSEGLAALEVHCG